MQRFLGLACLATLSLTLSASGANIYVSQSGAGSQNGTSAANAYPLTWLNNSANWGTGAGQIGPGTTVVLEGTITAPITLQGSGSAGSPITVLFDANCVMTAPAWSSGAIQLNNLSYITINGGVNGTINATACGTAYNNRGSTGIDAQQCSYFTVENLTISNLYVRTSDTDESANIGGSCIANIASTASYHDFKVLNCTLHDAGTGINSDYGAGCSNYEFASNTIYRCNWGGRCGDRNSSSTMSGLSVHDNYFYGWANWNDTVQDNYHHNGFYAWAESGGTMDSPKFYNNTLGPGWGGPYQTAGIFLSGHITGDILVYNNLFIAAPGESAANGYVTIGSSSPSTYRIYNNTMIGTPGNPAGIGINVSGSTSATNYIDLENNIGIGLTTFVMHNYAGLSVLSANYNVAYDLSSGQAYSYSSSSSSSFMTFSQWQSMGYDVNGSSANPNLNASYFPQAGLSVNVIGKGANLSSYFTTDKNHNFRPSPPAPWTIGAYEFSTNGSPPPTFNLTVVNGSGSGSYLSNTVVSISASSITGETFTNWSATVPGLVANPNAANTTVTVNTNLTVTANYATNPSNTPPATGVVIPAGNATLISAPFALTGGYLVQPVLTSDPALGGEAIFTFTVTNAGNYVVQALVNAPTDGNNSFFVNIDAEPVSPTMIWDMPLTSGFQPETVSWRGNGTDTSNQFVPEVFTLAAGTHQLIIRGREINTQLQSVTILSYSSQSVAPSAPSGLHLVTSSP